jgi:hypothetical protein
VADTGPSVDQILAEWTIADPGADLARWQEGMDRYEAGSLNGARLDEAAELMCAALTHYVAGASIITGWADESPERAVARTIWNVFVATLGGGSKSGLSADSNRRLRLALAAARRGGYQPADLGGTDFMARFFDGGSRRLMALALSGPPDGAGVASVNLISWFTSRNPVMPTPVPPGEKSSSTAKPDESPAKGPAAAGSKWDTVKDRARQAQQHVNPVALQHGIEVVQGALIEANVAKVHKKTGKLKIKKLGIAKAALRPASTMRKAIDGASLTEHLKTYNDSSRSAPRGKPSSDAEAGRPIAASSPAEFASYGSKRDYLRDWARRLVVAAGVPPTEPLVMEHANMAAVGIGFTVFLGLGAPRGISDLSQYFGDGKMPEGTPLDTFDALYTNVSQAEAGQQAVDERIVAFLYSIWDDWIEGIRRRCD